MTKLAELLKIEPSKKQISLVKLALKNRNEYLSDLADYQVLYMAFIAFCWAFSHKLVESSPGVFVLMGLSLFICVIYAFNKRIDLRKDLQTNNELINIFTQYENEHV